LRGSCFKSSIKRPKATARFARKNHGSGSSLDSTAPWGGTGDPFFVGKGRIPNQHQEKKKGFKRTWGKGPITKFPTSEPNTRQNKTKREKKPLWLKRHKKRKPERFAQQSVERRETTNKQEGHTLLSRDIQLVQTSKSPGKNPPRRKMTNTLGKKNNYLVKDYPRLFVCWEYSMARGVFGEGSLPWCLKGRIKNSGIQSSTLCNLEAWGPVEKKKSLGPLLMVLQEGLK